VRLLLLHGANVNALGGAGRGTSLQSACYHGYTDIIQLLFDNGVDVNACGRARGNWGRQAYGTALQTACSRGKTNIVQLLLDNGADVNARGMNDQKWDNRL
jgi:ankyrin repeat protein